MTKIRGFEKVKDDVLNEHFGDGFADEVEIILPQRGSKNAAGYDFFAQQAVIIPYGGTVLVPVGIKAYMQDDEVLYLYDRSSNPTKKGIALANSVGVIDSDYYGNESNDGMIFGCFKNVTDKEVVINRGDAIMQGVFQKFLPADDGNTDVERTGGIGSTGN